MEEKKEKKLYQKWWLWVCIVLIVLLVCFTSIVVLGFKTATSGINGIALQIQNIYADSTLYTSAGNNSLILELKHMKESDAKNLDFNKIFQPIKNNLKTELSGYSKLIIIDYIDTDNKENAEIVYMSYTLPDLKEENTQIYVDEEYLQTSINNSILDMLNDL